MEENKLNVQVPDNLKTGVYANGATISVRDDDVVVDFGYMLGGVNPPTMQVVSRVNMTHVSAERFASALQNALLDHRNKRKGK